MSSKKNAEPLDKETKHRLAHEAEGAASGALAGGILGAAAGPPGIAAGAIIGGIAGAIAGKVMDEDSSWDAERTREIDAETGVSGGELGAPNLQHPRPKTGAYSAATAGEVPASEKEPAEGPFQPPES